ncbi:kinase-like domain-containing protein [Dichotomopilus funicola]|uniref:Kinase-like domain-containing protein n=1 Tax=Dichotomopilus funicola TaxID=1934379 RepID=A0AAN6UY59_9PEZI|nr:kinase-like domain-containing protein [Dichotomopilus funicola]
MSTEKKDLEDGCFAQTFERKYYHREDVFIKRNLRPREYRTGYRCLHVPRLGKERLMNEAAALRYIRQHTDIPVPRLYLDFEDDEAYYLATEYIEGVGMSSLSEEQRAIVNKELSIHLAKLKTVRSNRIGGPSGLVIPSYRVMRQIKTDDWRLQVSDQDEFVFCHNDLSQQNVIVDPDMLKINAIIDWEYAGFYPEYFERPFYTRLGPSVAVGDEVDDSEKLLEFLRSRSEEAT